MADIQEKIEQGAQQVHDINATIDQFGVPQVPNHFHNGSDSNRVSFQDLIKRNEFLHIIIPGTSAATSTNYGVFFIAPYKCTFVGATEVHSTAGGSTPTLQIEKLVNTQATGSGINFLAFPFTLSATANTVQTAIPAYIPQPNFTLNKGDRLGLSVSGTLTSLAQVVVIVQLSY